MNEEHKPGAMVPNWVLEFYKDYNMTAVEADASVRRAKLFRRDKATANAALRREIAIQNKHRAYKAQGFDTFEEFVFEVYGYKKSHAHQMVNSTQIEIDLLAAGVSNYKPLSEYALRSLGRIDISQRARVYAEAREEWPHWSLTGKQIIATAVRLKLLNMDKPKPDKKLEKAVRRLKDGEIRFKASDKESGLLIFEQPYNKGRRIISTPLKIHDVIRVAIQELGTDYVNSVIAECIQDGAC